MVICLCCCDTDRGRVSFGILLCVFGFFLFISPCSTDSAGPHIVSISDHSDTHNITFFLSKIGKLNFLSVTKLKSRSCREITNAIERDWNKHEQRGFEITDIHGENEFNIQLLRDFLQPINLHIYAKEEHVGFIDNAIKKIKERARSVCHTTPYRRYTSLMTQSLIKVIIDMLNLFPSKNAISDTMGPAMLVEVKHKLDFGKKIIEFWAYSMVYIGTHNNMKKGAYQQSL